LSLSHLLTGPLSPWYFRARSRPSPACASRAVYKMNSLPTVLIKPGEADRVLAGHPWIYEGAVLRVTAEPKDGDVVQVKDHRQRFLGVGFWNSRSRIRVRVLAPERVEINQDFFEQRIREALAVRRKHLPRATSFRA